MQTTYKHFASLLTGGVLVLVLTAAGELWAADQIRGIGGPVAGNSPVRAAAVQPETSGEQGESETDGWFRWYFWRPRYCYWPVYYYYPVYSTATWGSYVVYYDGTDGASGTAKQTASDTVTDGLSRPGDAH
jgi:hypothetical protein